MEQSPAAGRSNRPGTVAEVLEHAAAWLTLADQAFALVRSLTQPASAAEQPGTAVQGDLLMLASALREHPDVDLSMYSVLEVLDAT